jgi:adenosylhomocysteine nucleosidase
MDLTTLSHRHGQTPGRDRLIECFSDLVAKASQAFGYTFDNQEDGSNLILGTIASGDRFVQDIDMLR